MAISDLLALSEDTAFAQLGEEATYTPTGGSATSIKVMPIRPDEIIGVAETRVHTATAVFEVRVSEVANPLEGEPIVFDGTNYTIKGKPTREDPRRRIWTIETVAA